MSPPTSAAAAAPPAQAPPPWLRLPAKLPLPVLYAAGGLLAFLAHRVLRHRLGVVRENLAGCFPELSAAQLRRLEGAHYAGLGRLAAEVVKSAAMDVQELNRRVRCTHPEVLRQFLDAGSSTLILAAHHSNWEWLLLALSAQLGYPLDAAYKPLRGATAERAIRALRTHFGGRLIPAKELLPVLIRSRGARGIAMLADQVPTSSDYRWWTRFLGRPTAFYMGPEKIAQALRAAVVYADMRRTGRGRYEIGLELLAKPREALPPGTVTERYARAVERSVQAAPADWTWMHRRWKLQPEADTGTADQGA